MRPPLYSKTFGAIASAIVIAACGGEEPPGQITLSASSLSVSAVKGLGNPATQTITLLNGGGGTVVWSATDDADWLSVSPASGSQASGAAATSLSVAVDVGALNPGSYSGTIVVTGESGIESKNITVALTVAQQPEITLSVSTLSYSAQQGSSPSSQSVTITNTGGGPLAWSATTDAAWLTVSPGQGTAPGTLVVAANGSGLAAGAYTGKVTVNGTGASNTPRTIAVAYTVTPPPAIGVSASTFTFNGATGGANPADQTLTITNTGGGTLAWTATKVGTWLTLSASSGTAPSTVTLSASTSGLAVGSYSGTITIASTNASNSPQTIAVTLTVSTPSTIGLSPSSFTFSGVQGGSNPATQTLAVSNSGGGSMAWTASKDAAWLSLSATSGTAPSTITLTVNTAGLAAGTYDGKITIAAAGATNTPQTVAVQLTVTPVYDGSWTGKTSQDSTITFTIANNAITQVSFGWRASGSCSVTGKTTTTFTTPVSVASGSFSLSGSGTTSYSMTGTLASAKSMSGTFSLSFSQAFPSCSASSGSQTYTATRP